MKALSIDSYYATLILEGEKTVECRSWKTSYRGDLLICANSRKNEGCLVGRAVCVAELIDIVPFARVHLKDACMDITPWDSNSRQYYAWIIRVKDEILPIKIKGQLNLFNVDDDMIVSCLDFANDDEEFRRSFNLPADLDNYINDFRDSIVTPAYYHYNKLNVDNQYGFNADFAKKFFDLSGVDPHEIWSEFPTGYTE